jgi:uncharacterized protein YciI
MPYAILTTDRPDHLRVRYENRPVHLEFLVTNQHRLPAAGALIEDYGSGEQGGMTIIDTDGRSEAEAFIAGDPFPRASLFENVTVNRWRKAFSNFEKLI